MIRLRHHDRAQPLLRVRFTDEWIGLLVLLCLAVFVAAVVEAGILRNWLTPAAQLRLTLPENGIAGLAVGNDIELMGTRVGSIRAVHLNQNSQMYAVANIDPQFKSFVRKDSTVTIRRRFVVAGASYIDLSRGHGEQMDWEFAELPAKVEPNPADMITHTLADIEKQVVPIMHNAEAITADLKTVTDNIKAGRGSVGELLSDDTLLKRADATVLTLQETIERLKPIEGQVTGVLNKADGTMANLRATSADVHRMTPDIHDTIRHADAATAQLPALLTQAEATAGSLKKLSDQLRGLWLLGGGGQKTPSRRLPPRAIAP
ncbi:ABC transporter periplasmic protein [Neoasaia chiangmaiensis NBRC 101099]|uniref:ABC transporter substrate-binding protein n=1 Tax=Neoasaia chiangmaiensis TaxID=320497 RepID=A0A1U9KN00_9PROT|nr:MCE family protein [Neoasaia chiangmaiensis]AQS87172.1 ABC transporter substrate-binding protein [Neoasaia chiangmaiensis]GBR38224.1 ABC transporter periplasmic protein [Neoasaia chiangmaiensis NBRC 101099]GEN15982.1 hypothetical protein NCH01_24130 [Neoasaia chiangmaiensis]